MAEEDRAPAALSGAVPVSAQIVNTRWVDRYMAVPFKKGGRSFAGVDCWGGYELVLAHELGEAAVPRFNGVSMKNPAAVRRAINGAIATGQFHKIDGRPVEIARAFDAVLMLTHVGGRRADLHIGCATGDGRVLHWEEGVGARCVRLDDSAIAWRFRTPTHGVYRPAFLTDQAAA